MCTLLLSHIAFFRLTHLTQPLLVSYAWCHFRLVSLDLCRSYPSQLVSLDVGEEAREEEE